MTNCKYYKKKTEYKLIPSSFIHIKYFTSFFTDNKYTLHTIYLVCDLKSSQESSIASSLA